MQKIIGLTGPSGAGKSTVSEAFRALGAHTIDADIIARRVVEKGKPALSEIENAFGSGVMRADGTLDRRALADIVFHSPEELHKLNKITHKYITEEIQAEIGRFKESVVVIDAAVLFESGLNRLCDCVVCVTADKKTRVARIMKRDGLTEKMALDRINAQQEDAFYIKNSDFHIENNGGAGALGGLAKQIIQGVCSE